MNRWSLPGPTAFFESLSGHLRDGSSVVVAVPTTVARPLSTALSAFLREQSWGLSGPLEAGSGTPVGTICDKLDLRPDRRPSAAAIVAGLEPGRVVFIVDVHPVEWAQWRSFLDEYEAASRAVPAFDRPLLVVMAEGLAASSTPENGAALRTLKWDGTIGELDMLMYVAERMRIQRKPFERQQKLIARVIARLALWDFDLADFLLDQEPAELFEPLRIVQHAANTFDTAPLTGTWEGGGIQTVDGLAQVHPFVIAAQADPEEELPMRVWAAQASEVLPALEMHRRALVRRMSQTGMKLPVEIRGEAVTDLDDLEIGSLAFVAHQQRLSPEIRRLANKWRNVRNKLAHLEPLTAAEALDPELLRPPAAALGDAKGGTRR